MPFPPVDRPPPAESSATVDRLVTAVQALVKFLTPFKDQRSWTNVVLFSDWAGLVVGKPLQWTMDGLGRVELRGSVLSGGGASTTIGHIPVGFRPAVVSTFPASAYNGARVFASIDIQPNGRIILVTPAVAANVEVYLDGIRFDTRV